MAMNARVSWLGITLGAAVVSDYCLSVTDAISCFGRPVGSGQSVIFSDSRHSLGRLGKWRERVHGNGVPHSAWLSEINRWIRI